MSQISLFGSVATSQTKKFRRNEKGRVKRFAPWHGICCEACWYAHKEVCRCRCGGVNHGKGLSGSYSRLEDFGKDKKKKETCNSG